MPLIASAFYIHVKNASIVLLEIGIEGLGEQVYSLTSNPSPLTSMINPSVGC